MKQKGQAYIALVRGINVGGRSMISMADLRQVFVSLGFANVTTYIQTGNVLFSAKEIDPERLAHRIEERLRPLLGPRVKVFLFSAADLKKAVARNPFHPERSANEVHCQFMFLADSPASARRKALLALQGEDYRFHISNKMLYYTYPKQFAGHRRTINFEKVLGVSGTTRTWNVVNQLIKLAEEQVLAETAVASR